MKLAEQSLAEGLHPRLIAEAGFMPLGHVLCHQVESSHFTLRLEANLPRFGWLVLH